MTNSSKSILSYDYTKPTWDAIYEMSRREPNHEITIDRAFESIGERIKYSKDMNMYRKLLREVNRSLYPKGHPSYGTTIFDHFKIINAEEDGRLVLKARKDVAKPTTIRAGSSEIYLDTTPPNTTE